MKNRPFGDDEMLVRRVLAANSTFSACQPQTQELLLQAATVRRYAKGESILAYGQAVKALYVVLCGSLEFGILAASGKRYVRWYLEPGQMHGFIALIDGNGAIYGVRAHEDAVLLLIPRAEFLQGLADPALNNAVMLSLCERSRSMHAAASADALLSLSARVARMILMLVDAHGRVHQQGIVITLKLSQEMFADMLAVSRQRLNKELKVLESEGIIETAYSQITIVDLPRLQLAAQDTVDPVA